MSSSTDYVAYTDSIISILTSQTDDCASGPSLTKILNLFVDYHKCDHFFLLQKPEVVTSHFVLCSDIVNSSPLVNFTADFNEPSAKIVQSDSLKIITFEKSQHFLNLPNISSLSIINVTDDVILVLINPKNCEIDRTILNLTTCALKTLYERNEIDYEYSIKQVYAFSDDTLEKLSKRSFSVINYHPSEIFLNTFALFVRSKISGNVGIDDYQLLHFLVKLRRHYNDVPYHNWFHALDVTQFVYSVIVTGNIKRYLEDIEIFSLLFSAICHDTDHNGMNNAFHRKAHTTLAHLAPNLPPLEHHHSCLTMDLSRSLFLNCIKNDEQRAYLSKFVINCIMATDMEQHKVFLTEFKEITDNGFDKTKESHRQLLSQIVLKAADLSNTVRDFDEAVRMTTKLNNECHRQGDREVELNLPISPMCDRNDKTPMCVGQIGFYRFVAGPLMKELHAFFPELKENEMQFEGNVSRWEKMKEDLAKQ
ncbi:3'5'-cyclic nucleotide phosphodiesterase family protein [Tritrichomonas foetus]|uniref:3'5'-cyclic nucleotide phosphodiesterase family protein n=1 Tax=Tritrichomonas foetus TaxID=1144522 RepID=A0A1J4JH50_9EUKA|nr:3'5'-cyclic nucleotide phosphodiesterase family protein [Tritrichomonas foetus]|eukprot:OHS98480.1 3'5'-cyclic nucleotide phosphodiesterase family protein [Tritrichomonas foetus]